MIWRTSEALSHYADFVVDKIGPTKFFVSDNFGTVSLTLVFYLCRLTYRRAKIVGGIGQHVGPILSPTMSASVNNSVLYELSKGNQK